MLTLMLVVAGVAQIVNKGNLNISQTTALRTDSGFTSDCNLYTLMTHFRKTELYMQSISPENVDISQKVIFTDVLYDKCPLSCADEQSFCKEFDGNTFTDL